MEQVKDLHSEAETARIEAETAKLRSESHEIEKRLAEKWYQGRFFVQALIAGIAASGLIVGWVKTQLEPMLTAKQDRSVIELEVAKKSNELEAVRNQIAQEKLNKQLSDLKRENQELAAAQDHVRTLLESRAQAIKKGASEDTKVKEELAELQAQLKQLKEAKTNTEQRAKNIESAFKPSLSRTCQYVTGPKSGRKEYFPLSIPVVPALIGQPCHDGFGSVGYAVPDE